MSWPRTDKCKMCGGEFQRWRPQHLYCKDAGCQKKRQRYRWDQWRKREEEAGRFRDKINTYQRAYRERTGYGRDYELRTKYGITIDEWLAMVDAVDGRCEIFKRDDRTLCVDHCHVTSKVRGVLCRSCNAALGQLGDTLEAVESAAQYLRQHYETGLKEAT